MDSLWILFDKATGQITKMSSTAIDNEIDSRQMVKVPDAMLADLNQSNSISRLFFDFKAAIVENNLVLHDSQETIIDVQFKKMIPITYVHKHHSSNSDLKLEITSLNNKPILKVTFCGNQLLRSNKFKNKELIHLTAKNDINTHYQTFEIDLTKFDNELIFDIDRCDYKLLFSNQISFYHRKKLNVVYTIT